MKKKIFQITLILGITLSGLASAFAMPSCEEAQPGELCTFSNSEELEVDEGQDQETTEVSQSPNSPEELTVLPSNGNAGSPGVILIHNQNLAKAPVRPQTPKNYQSPEGSQYRSPLSQAGI